MGDIINLEIMEDGVITVKTSAISDGNHISADNLLADMEKLMGGQVTKQKNPDRHNHAHINKSAFAH